MANADVERPVAKAEGIAGAILLLRGQRVMLDSDLAVLYGVETGQLVRAVKRSPNRFPRDFMFQLSNQEVVRLRCQIGISNVRGGRRY
ncbi:MAG TPA: ORF6N domain-containing protein, partial [Gammaproteobacteria bacterium]|nr:ORF6N domain-containing protein [Gammaproteobacteria bacterium]